MRGLLHIGMPKCMSTSIQAYLRSASNVFFMGIGPSKFVKPDVLLAFQRHIMRMPAHFYDAEAVANVFRQGIEAAKGQDADIFALSDESIPFPRGYSRADTSYLERLLRLKAVMPGDTRVLMVTRNPKSYLQSSYKYRTVMNGLSCSFEDYMKRLLLLGDANLLGTVKYYFYAEVARQVFGAVDVVAMEEIAEDERALLRHLGTANLPSPVHDRLPRENSGMPSGKFANFRELYAPFGDALSDDDFNGLSPADKLMTQADTVYYGGVLAAALGREQTLAALRNLALKMPDQPAEACFAMSDRTRKLLTEYVVHANAMLKKQFGVDTEKYAYDVF
ncbi:MAG TPA: hypothetical protein VG867_08355 [Rhizomicrobium sp.]|nr:hypothetical protein [Rhizomicrobium sp.]